MDAKITKKRLGHMLSYDWIKIIAICAAVVFVWVMLFATLATRATMGQTFEIYVYTGITVHTDRISNLNMLHSNGALSYDVLDYNFTTLSEPNTQLSAYMPNNQGDVMFITDTVITETTTDEETGTEETTITDYGDLHTFLNNYLSYISWAGEVGEVDIYGKNVAAESYFGNCAAYLSEFYKDKDGDGTGDIDPASSPEQDTEKIESAFRSRIRKDKRYKRESDIKEGLEREYDRIEKLRVAYNNVEGYFADGTLGIREKELTLETDSDEDGNNDTVKVQYAIDLSGIRNIEDFMINNKTEDENGAGTGKDLCMLILNEKSQEAALRYEAVTFLDYIVKTYNAE